MNISLNLGCGRDIRSGWINVDCEDLPGVDIVGDIADPATFESIPSNSVSLIEMSHILEHIIYPLPMLEALYRVAKPGCILNISVPHGAHDMAFADPQHVKQYFPSSFQFFAQPAYKRADYKYRGDWETKLILLRIDPEFPLDEHGIEVAGTLANQARNFVWEMRAKLIAVKPLRPVETDWQYNPQVSVELVK
jgi:SAM-dependent methyltransferase